MFSQYSNGESDPKGKQADPTLAPKDQMGNKWQYLQQELSSKMKSPLCQLVEPQVRFKFGKTPFLQAVGCGKDSNECIFLHHHIMSLHQITEICASVLQRKLLLHSVFMIVF